jgi:hypothetical protein
MTDSKITTKVEKLQPAGFARTFFVLGSELLFILLPFIVSAIVLNQKGEFTRLFYLSEWSLAASVLMGQSVVKLISGILSFVNENRGYGRAHWEFISLLISGVIVLGLAPALIVLTLVLSASPPSKGLAVAQGVLFVLGLIVFLVVGGVGQAFMMPEKAQSSSAPKAETSAAVIKSPTSRQ